MQNSLTFRQTRYLLLFSDLRTLICSFFQILTSIVFLQYLTAFFTLHTEYVFGSFNFQHYLKLHIFTCILLQKQHVSLTIKRESRNYTDA